MAKPDPIEQESALATSRVGVRVLARDGLNWRDFNPGPLIGKEIDAEVLMLGVALAKGRYRFVSITPSEDGTSAWVVLER
jgi:hypothetical protein